MRRFVSSRARRVHLVRPVLFTLQMGMSRLCRATTSLLARQFMFCYKL
jgi:hypothetical protein